MSKYILFTHDQHDNIRWDYTPNMIERVVSLWEKGYSYEEIAKKTFLKKVEVMLILLDLAHLKKVPERKNGIWGNKGA